MSITTERKPFTFSIDQLGYQPAPEEVFILINGTGDGFGIETDHGQMLLAARTYDELVAAVYVYLRIFGEKAWSMIERCDRVLPIPLQELIDGLSKAIDKGVALVEDTQKPCDGLVVVDAKGHIVWAWEKNS